MNDLKRVTCRNIRLMSIIFVVLMGTALSTYADTWTDPDTGYTWTYSINGSEAEIYSVTNSAAVSPAPSGELIIPFELGGAPLTVVGDMAFYRCSGITSVTIPDSVKHIGKYAFFACSGMSSVVIPNSVTNIGISAFASCSGLEKVTIPENVIRIEGCAFRNCTGLKKLDLPYGVTIIGPGAFMECSSLRGFYIPDSVTSIGDSAFRDCSGLLQATIPSSVRSLEDYVFDGCTSLTSVTIPNGVRSIGRYAFCNCSSLEAVSIPDTVTSIGSYAFVECSSLIEVVIPGSVTSLGTSAFSVCSNLANVTINEGVRSIGAYAFCDCSSLAGASIPDSVESIGVDAFYGCSNMLYDDKSVPCVRLVDGWAVGRTSSPSGVLNLAGIRGIGDVVFSGCNDITSVVIPDGVKAIGYRAFRRCKGIARVEIAQSVKTIGAEAFNECTGLSSVSMPDGLVSLGVSAFLGCSSSLYDDETLPGIRLVDGWAVSRTMVLSGALNLADVRGFANGLFSDCTDLTELEFASNLKSICPSVFSGCIGLSSVTIPDSVTTIGASAFRGCRDLTSVTIPDSVTSIGSSALSGCSGLTNVTIPDSVTSIGERAFEGCSGLTSVTIPDSVTSIGYRAFEGCSGLTSVTIPQAGVDSFYVFSGYSNLALTISESVTSIGPSAFENCGSLTSVTMPDSVTSIGERAFSGCSGLTSVTIPASVTIIGGRAFSGCGGLSLVVFKGDRPQIGVPGLNEWATFGIGHENCNVYIEYDSSGWEYYWSYNGYYNGESRTLYGLPIQIHYGNEPYRPYPYRSQDPHSESFSIANNVLTAIDDNIRDVVIPYGVTRIGDFALSGHDIATVRIPGSVTSIGDSAFSSCNGLTSVIIPDGVTSIGDGAFSGCSGLTDITIPDTISNIGNGVFQGCVNLQRLLLPGKIIGSEESFTEKYVITSKWKNGWLSQWYEAERRHVSGFEKFFLTIAPRTVTLNLLDGPWRGDPETNPEDYQCTLIDLTAYDISGSIPDSLTDIIITSGTRINAGAFRRCMNVKNVTIPDSVTSIGKWAFDGCGGLESVYITDVAKWCEISFEYDYFANPLCYAHNLYLNGVLVEDLTIPDGVTQIGARAFYGCNGLTSVTIPDSVKSIGDWAFDGCNGITSVKIPQCVCASQLSTVFPSAYQSIREVIVTDGVTSLGDGLFSGCTMLNSITIPDSVTTIGDSAFYNCSGLTSVTIPDSVVNIGDNAFKGCNGLSKVTIPNVVCASTISTVFPSAYQSIREVVLPDSATGLGEGLFSGCRMLSSVIISKDVVTIGDFAFSDCSNLEGVKIPYGVKAIGAYAFARCVALEDVTIPYSIKQLGDYAFSGCSSLHRIVLPGWLRGTFDESTFSGNADDFEIVYIDGVGICVNASDMGFFEGKYCLWYGDRDVSHDGIASARLKGMGQDSESSIELYLDSPGRLSFWWKASSESDGNNVFDYACLSIDGVPQGTLNKESYRLNGVAIGGKTGWRHEVIDVAGKGSHVIRWTYVKDEIDEGDTGDDCVWLDEVGFTPLAYLSFDIAGGTGMVPAEISELEGTVVTLPAQSGFEWEDHVFNGWSDGKATYAAESQYVVPASNVTFTAQWIAKRFLTFALDGGDGQNPIAIKDVPGAEIKLPSANGISRAKHVFVGWSDGATTYDAGAKYRVTDASVEFKAVWQRKEAYVSIVSDDVVNGGTVDTQGATISMSAWTNPSVGTPAIYYTLDGTEPTTSSTRYEGPFFVGTLGDVTVRAFAVLDDCFDGEATFSFTRLPYSLRECVAMEGVNVAVGGATPWFRVTGEAAHDGKAAMRSGVIGDGENSYVEMQVRGEVEVSFWWKISSQNKVRADKHDYLAFSVDGEEALTLGGGVIDWTNATYAVTGSGRHSLRWTYIKDGADASNEDCAWLDDVVWSPTGKLCAVSFDANGGEVSECERKVREGSAIGDLPQPQRYGYIFDGWFTAVGGGDEVESDTEITDSVTYYAHWKVEITFDANGGTGGKTVTQDYGTALSAPTVTRVGYTFNGWSPAVPATVPAGGATYTAQWKVNQYAVAFDANGGEGSVTNEQDYASEIVAPEVSRTGYSFVSWSPEVGTTVPASNVVYTAQWSVNQYMATFDANGGSGGKAVTQNYGTELAAPTVTRTGYSFAGWRPSVPTTMPAADRTFVAQWTANQYTVTFDPDGGVGGWSRQMDYGTEIAAPTPTREGYVFNYWLRGRRGDGYTIWYGPPIEAGEKITVTDNVTYYAQWTINKYTVTFNANGGAGGWSRSMDYGSAVTAPTVTRTGYTFTGWSPAVPATVPAGNATYVAQWTKNKYTVTFNANGGAGGWSKSLDYGAAVVMPTVTRVGYNFAGWSPAVAKTVPIGGAYYTAQWTINRHQIRFALNGGEGVGSVTVDYGTSVGDLPVPTREGYEFLGWFTAPTGGSMVADNTIVTGDMTLYAQWHIVLPELYEMIDGAAPDMAASEYNGYLYDEKSGTVKGTIYVKVGKPGKKDGKAMVKATVVVGTKKITLKGAEKGKASIASDEPTEIELVGKGAEECSVMLGAYGITGYYGAYIIDGARNIFSSKDKGDLAEAKDALDKCLGSRMVIWDGGSVSVSIAAKGKVKVSGTLASGAKVSATAVLLVGEEWNCVSVAAPRANLSFVLWLSRDGKTTMVEGLGADVLVGSAGTLADGAVFSVPADAALWSAIPGEVLTEYLPNGVPVTKKGTKWTLPKVGRITMKKGVIDVSKAGENPSGLKLTYKAKDGTFKGSFKVYAENKGRLKATTVNVTGFLLNGIGFGTATIKKVGSVSVRIVEK